MSRARDFADLAGAADAGGLTGRNLVINGAMQVAQRGTSFTSTGYTLDRMQMLTANTDNVAFTTTQSSTAPDGFANSLKVDITTAETTLDSNELFRLLHKIEGQDLQHLSYGSSAAKSVTLSFYVRSNVTGIYTVEFRLNASGTSTITKQYTISSADTWERKELTLPANTATAISNNNSNGFEISFALAAGSNFTTGALGTSWATTATESRYAGHAANVMSSTSNEWYITGVQLEVGEQATPFEHRSFGDELARCRRYFERIAKSATQLGQSSDASPVVWSGLSRSGNSGNNQGMIVYETKRNNPTLSVSAASHFNGIYPISPFASSLSGFAISGTAGLNRAYANATNNASSAPTTDCGSMVNIGDSSGYLDIDAEL